jgi:hypothetical protein
VVGCHVRIRPHRSRTSKAARCASVSVGPLAKAPGVVGFTVALVLTLTWACGERSPVAPSASPAPSSSLHAEVIDPRGDVHYAIDRAPAPNPPDLISGTADVQAGAITFTVRFAPGTFDPRTTRHNIDLDTDESTATGILGLDYIVYIGTSTDLSSALIQRQQDKANVGTVSVSFVADGFDVVIPLALLGNDDGRMTFRVRSYASAYTGSDFDSSTVDFMPDQGLPPGRVQ